MLMEVDPNDPPDEGPFYVIECYDEPGFVTDESGITKTFDTYPEAAVEAADCPRGYVLAFSA